MTVEHVMFGSGNIVELLFRYVVNAVRPNKENMIMKIMIILLMMHAPATLFPSSLSTKSIRTGGV